MTRGSPLLIALPDGLNASGVTTWAVRLASALAASGRVCGLVLHPEPPGQRPIDVALHPGVRIFDLRRLPRLDAEGGGAFAPAYLAAARSLGARPGGPVVLSPNLVGECYAVAAELTRAHADAVRTIAVHHSDLAYNDAVCAHFEPIVHAFVGVSERITDRLRRNLPARAADVHRIPYGVEAAGIAAPRPPLAGRPVRLLYAGRIEHEQKRVRSLVAMSDALAARGVAHELALVGDGPACPEIDAACASRSWVRRLPPRSPAGIAALLDAADLFVLASRYEGLSVSVLEAMARGCTPVITRTASGAGEQITEGVTGFLVDADDGDDAATGDAMADAVQRAIRAGPHRAGAAAAKRARDCFSVERMAGAYAAILDGCAAAPARRWAQDRAVAFTTVPADAAERMRAVLDRLAGRRIVVHGAGRHTTELAGVLAESPACVVAFSDDDPARQGGAIRGVPIVAPTDAALTGATDVLISTFLHESAVWERRGVYERQGLRVHRVYGHSSGSEASSGFARSLT